MNYFLLIENAKGESRLVPITDIEEIAVIAGDDIVVMDEQGNPVDVSLKPDGKNLVVNFKNGESVVLKGFYEAEEGSDPITISLNPKEPVDTGYEFNSQTGNLPNAKSFTLMRFSNTEYVNFVEQIDELGIARFGGAFAAASSGLGGGGGSGHSPNVAPEAVDDAGETDQNTPLVITVLANDTDANPNDALVVKGVDQPERGSVSINAENQLIFDPGNDFVYLGAGESEVVSFNYSIFDGNGGTDTATVTIVVHGVDDASITAPDSGVTNEDAPVTIDVLANDYDPDTNGNPLWVESVTQPGLGIVTNNINDVTFNPGADFNYLAAGETATVTFTYTTNTGVTENVTVTIHGVNDAPDANDDDRSTDQNSSLLIDALSNDTDPDTSDALIITGVTQPGKGTVTYNAGDLTFDPGGDFDSLGAGESETVTFTYSISDGNGGTDTATITVTINGVDDATVTAPDTAVTNEDTPVTINVLANDTDPDSSDVPLTIVGVTQPLLGSVVNNGTDVTYDPGADFQYLAAGESATVTFTYTTDTGATENVSVTINGVNDGPAAINDARTTDQDTAIVIDAIDNDTDADGSDVLLITGVDQPARGTTSINASNQIVFNPGNAFDDLGAGESATVTFNYSISDGNGGTDTATITVTINGVDDATVTAPDASATDEDTPVVIDVLANDSDVDTSDNPLTILSVTQPVLGSVVNNGTNVTFNPGMDFQNLAAGESATVTFTYTTDTGVTENVTVTIKGLNDGPDAINDARTTNQNTAITIDATANDTDPDASDLLLIIGVDQPSQGSASINASNQIVFDPGNEFDYLGAGESATVTFNYSIFDGNGGTDTATITVTINGVDDATVTAPDAAATNEDTPVVIDVLANDSDADTSDNPLTITSVTQPTLGLVVNNGSNVTFNPGTDFQYLAVGETATVTFTYTTDTGATENVTVTVTGANDGPDAVDDTEVTDQSTPVVINAISNDTDPDASDVLFITGVDQPDKGSAVINASNQIVFNPGSDFDDLGAGETATVTFNYTISDGNGGTDTATITVTVNGLDDPTTTNPDTASTNEDTPVIIDVLSNDSDVDSSDNPLAISGVTQPVLGLVTNNGSDLTFNPNGDFEYLAVGETATVTFTYTTSTGATEGVTVTIHGVNDAPTAVDDAETTDQNSIVNFDLVSNDTDPDGDSLAVVNLNGTVVAPNSVVGLPSGANITLLADGTVNYNPNGQFVSLGSGESVTDSFTYVVSDGNGGTATATAVVTIHGIDDPTVTNPDTGITDEDTPVIINVLANDSDPDTIDIPLSVASVAQPGLGLVTNNGSDLTFDPNGDFEYLAAGETATVTFTYTTTTGATENVTVTITGENDAPLLSSTVTSGTVYEAGLPSGTGIGSTTTAVTGVFTTVDADGDALLIRVNGVDLGFLDGNPATIVGTVSGDDGSGELTVFGDGSWSYQLLNEAVHDGDDSTFNDNEREDFSVTVFDGTVESAPVNLAINIVDDVVVIGTPSSGSLLNSANTSYTGSLGSAGADANFSSLTGAISGWNGTSTTFAATSLTSQGKTVYYFVDPSDESILIAYTDSSGTPSAYNPLNPSQSAVFILDVEASNDSYQLTMFQPVDIWESTSADFSVLSAAGPKDFYLFTDGPSLLTSGDPIPPGESVVFSVYSTIAGGKVNSNSNYLGINNNLVDPGESVTVDLVQQGRTVSIAYAFNGGGTNTQIAWTAYATDDVTVLATGVYDAGGINTGSFTISHNWLKLGKVELAPLNSNTKSFRIATIVVGGFDSENPLDLNFPVTVIDDDGDFASAVIQVEFYNPTGPPIAVAMPDAETTDQNSFIVIDALGNDIDSDPSDPLTITSITQPGSGSASINGSNQIVFDPGNDFSYLGAGESATVTFEYTMSNGVGGTDTATITVTVTGLNDPTLTAPDSDTTNEDNPVTIDVLANDSDVDLSDNPLTIASVTQPALGLVTHNGTTLTFNPNGQFESLSVGDTATVTFSYTTNTGATENVTVTITGVNDAPVANDDIVVSTTDIVPVSINVVANDTDVDGTVDPATVDLDVNTAGIQTTLTVAGEGTWTTNGAGMVTFTPTAGINNQPTPITYAVSDNSGATSTATIDLKYSAADVWFGNDESGSVNTTDFNQSRTLISGAANQMSFATGSIAFNAALFTWADSSSQQMELNLNDNKTSFVNSSSTYSRNFSGGTDIGAGIVFGTQQILASVAARQLANHPRAGVPQVMVILTDATSSQILNDSSLLADAQAAKDAGIILVFVAIQEAQQDPLAVARLQQAASVDGNGDPFVITAANYSDIGPATIADLLNEIREAAAAGLLPPIVIDLDGDGAEFTSIENGILFDVDGDGVLEQVAWAGRDDAVLVYDENGNNNVDSVREISFARYSDKPNATDLDGLRHFDTNNDLILDANDAEFESFKLWQDRNGNGIVDEGEMMTLSEAGIKSIELTSDGNTYYTAGGDVKVNGTTVVHYEDGTTGTAADAEFGYRELIEVDDSIEIITSEGDVLDLSSYPSGPVSGNDLAGPDLLEPSAGPVGESGEFSGSPMTTSLDDDLAAAGATVS